MSGEGSASSSTPRLSPNAPTFSFNPDASEFAPPSSWEDMEAKTGDGETKEESGSGIATASDDDVNQLVGEFKEVDLGGKTEEEDSSKKKSQKDESGAASPSARSGAAASSSSSTGTKKKETKENEDSENLPNASTSDAKEILMEKMKVNAGDPRPHMNVVFIGHVDAGKSTMSGQLLYATGNVDKRTINKYEKEAKTLNRESWFLAFIMDTNDEERAKGKTVEVGRAHFQTENRRFTILDAPGHKNYVPNMIQGAAQADIGVLVISARKGEFETGYERGGQTREHALLAKTLGVKELVVVVNKMDDQTVEWNEDRYNTIEQRIASFLKKNGFKKKNIRFVPISAITGDNIFKPVPKETCDWYNGDTLLTMLDNIVIDGRDPNAPLRIPILDKLADRGTVALGKVETGTVRVGQKVTIYPGAYSGSVDAITIGDSAEDTVDAAFPGENVEIKLKGIHEDHIKKGFVLTDKEHPVPVVNRFKAQLQVLELEHRGVFSAGYNAILHIHTMEQEVTVDKLTKFINMEKKEEKANPKFITSNQTCECNMSVPLSIPCEKYEKMPQMGRFTIRDEGRTIAIGKIIGLPREALQAAGQA
eukprot:gb/GECG01002351.1/.p1 GENE.gb/GECG01002351.1/~~gb/GECG01002351.1/.p1  ORF type:complete len:593 (+),score=109.41 gb/GECG01002351.1/:1-1779(+)